MTTEDVLELLTDDFVSLSTRAARISHRTDARVRVDGGDGEKACDTSIAFRSSVCVAL